MTRLAWDTRDYEIGLDRGVFYPKKSPAVVWNGLSSVQEDISDSEDKVCYIDGVKIQNKRTRGEFSGTIEAYMYPDSLLYYIERRRVEGFDLSYRVQTDNGYRIHIVYNVLLIPSTQSYQQDSTSPISWGFTTKPVFIPGLIPTSHLMIDIEIAYLESIASLEDILYGSNVEDPRMPLPIEIYEIFEANSILIVYDNGNGTFTVTGPDEAIQMVDLTTFNITWPSASYISADTYTIRSL